MVNRSEISRDYTCFYHFLQKKLIYSIFPHRQTLLNPLIQHLSNGILNEIREKRVSMSAKHATRPAIERLWFDEHRPTA